MTIASSSSRMPAYVGNGTASVFPVTIPFRKVTDLKVVVLSPTFVESQLAYNVQFSVSASSRSVTLYGPADYADATGKLKTGYKLFISREMSPVQETSIKDLGSFEPILHERAFDYLTMLIQEIADKAARALRLPGSIAPEAFDPRLPADIVGKAGRVLMTNLAGNGTMLGPSIADLNNTNALSQQAIDAAAAAAVSATSALASANSADASADSAAQSEMDSSTAALSAADSAAEAAGYADEAEDSATAAAASADLARGGSTKVVGTPGSPIVVTTSGYAFPTADLENEHVVFLKGGSGGNSVSANPQIAVGRIGQRLELHGCSNADPLTLINGNGLVLNGECYLANGSSLSLRCDGAKWREISRNNN